MLPRRSQALQIYATLRSIRPAIWRRIEIPSDLTLEELHLVMQASFGWSNGHLYGFDIGAGAYEPTEHEFLEAPAFGDFAPKLDDASPLATTTVAQAFCDARHFTYWYNGTERWVHDIELERVLPERDSKPHPVCTAGERSGPPDEHCGGVPGFRNYIHALHTRARRDAHATDLDGELANTELAELEVFDIEHVNTELRKIDKTMDRAIRANARRASQSRHALA